MQDFSAGFYQHYLFMLTPEATPHYNIANQYSTIFLKFDSPFLALNFNNSGWGKYGCSSTIKDQTKQLKAKHKEQS